MIIKNIDMNLLRYILKRIQAVDSSSKRLGSHKHSLSGSYNYHLGVVDGARPGISRGGSSGGGVAGDIAGDAGVGLNLGVDVGAHLDRALPELGDRRGDLVVQGGDGADVLEHLKEKQRMAVSTSRKAESL
eukprot:CAMPEP_0173091318 /NCGR_PEP_ID=MMETSP1102-20130122/27856_1 /TAXON_ID=49646 /ORGANISM="Geminigera sp., Strain Caron Lab Isolate" /LENGTH=130 /DNA_ID=CAMNT_0013977185 /DNA_START=651 /DNA_END=1044 /DNA_ORIENTATION=+